MRYFYINFIKKSLFILYNQHFKSHFLQIYILQSSLIIFKMQPDTYKSPKTVKLFFQSIAKQYTSRDSNKLSLTFKQLYQLKLYDNLNHQNWNINLKLNEDYSQIKDDITKHFIKILQHIKTYEINKRVKEYQNAFDQHMKIVIECLQIIKEIKQTNFNEWYFILKPIRVLIHATKSIFFNSMKHITTLSKLKNDLINTLNRFKSTRSLIQEVRVQILPLIDNMQVSILFNFHNYEMIKMIIYTSKLGLTNPQNKFRDNFLFLKAKYALVNENIKQAEQCFEMINLKTRKQKRLVLKYLIPCKIFLGKMFEFNNKNQEQHFPQYETLINALKNASFKSFDQTVQKYQKVWIKRGIYLLMDRLRILIWRNLIKRVFYVKGEKIMLGDIVKAVQLAGGEQSLNQCICIIGNLIYEGYIKGYIFQSEQIQGLVLKKSKDGKIPFPKLSQIAN